MKILAVNAGSSSLKKNRASPIRNSQCITRPSGIFNRSVGSVAKMRE